MPLPMIALVGRPNVGKSTLFNQLTQSKDALVMDEPGITRDRLYGRGQVGPCPYWVIDTGGMNFQEDVISTSVFEQAMLAIQEADVVLFVVDAQAGRTGPDEEITNRLRKLHKKVVVVVNKSDGLDSEVAASEFYALGLGEPVAISALRSRGLLSLMEKVLQPFVSQEETPLSPEQIAELEHLQSSISVAIVGRPNVGKSTLVNALLGEERVITGDIPGLTRDSIYIPFERRGQKYTLIDTAGIRRRGKIHEALEKFSVIKTLQSIDLAKVVVLVIDAETGLVDQDLHLLGSALDAGRSVVVAVNKWEGLSKDQQQLVKSELDRKLAFASFVPIRFISALEKVGITQLLLLAKQMHRAASQRVSTARMNEVLERAVAGHPPPMSHGRRIKLRYAHMGGQSPPLVVVHGNQTEKLPPSYQRYLTKYFREAFHWIGTPVRLSLVRGENPFEGKKNELNSRQLTRRRRMIEHRRKRG